MLRGVPFPCVHSQVPNVDVLARETTILLPPNGTDFRSYLHGKKPKNQRRRKVLMKNNKENRFTNQIAEMIHSENNQVLPAYNKMETLTFHPRLMKLRKWAIENTIFF